MNLRVRCFHPLIFLFFVSNAFSYISDFSKLASLFVRT
jgi:hypothetical protein